MSITVKAILKRQAPWSLGFVLCENGTIVSFAGDAKPLECVPS